MESLSLILKFYFFTRQLTFVGHSAGAHLILCMINTFLNKDPLKTVNIHAVYLISGIYDLTDLQHTIINKGNILTIDATNVNQLSPLQFDFNKWPNQRFHVKIYVAEYDSPTFIEQSFKLFELFQVKRLLVDFRLMNKCDHFDIVEKLSESSYEIIHDIISDTCITSSTT